MQTVLVVDDETAIATTLRLILEAEGYRVLVAHNGRDALGLLAGERPGLVIADAEMPLLDGPGLLRRMRDDPDLRDIPVVLMGALPAHTLGGLPYRRHLAKPFHVDALVALVAELAPREGATGQPGA